MTAPATAMRFLQVRNWDKYQHYKDRSPPWIKFYAELLDDLDFALMQDAIKWHVLGIWLLASRINNRIPYNAAWVGGRINATEPVDLDLLVSARFLEPYDPDSNALAGCTQGDRPEKSRGEKRRRDADALNSTRQAEIDRRREAHLAEREAEIARRNVKVSA